MSRIRVLPENIANQIAAGEVVERPASVIKELVENGIDAGAGAIDIQVEGDGTRLIRVIDDGAGMDADDVLLCLERHATSKLRSQEDLFAINTFGFRGEAIPSIASVSQMTIISRPPDRDLGTRVDIRYGTVSKVHETGCSAGTVMEVRNLFGNMPARRKFLKSKRTELAHVEEVVTALALANPAVAFNLVVNGRTTLRLAGGDDSVAGRFHRLFAGVISGGLVTVRGESAAVAVDGLLLEPDSDGAGRLRLRIFVNGRHVRDGFVSRAVMEGGQGFYMKGRRPAGILMLRVDPAAVDVNVHPTKQEVRFRKAAEVYRLVSQAVQRGLTGYQADRKRRVFQKPPAAPPAGEEVRSRITVPAAAPAAEDIVSPCRQQVRNETGAGRQASIYDGDEPPPVGMQAREPLVGPLATGGRPPVTVIGQLFDTYILCQVGDAFIVIDQHAAQERLLYEKLRLQYTSGQISRQSLLFPVMVELSAGRLQTVEQFGDAFLRLGVELQEFGGSSYLVKSVPALLGTIDPETIVFDMIDRFAEAGGGGAGDIRLEEVLARMACKAAIKASHRLEIEECRELVRQMIDADIFSHCPHGRPVVRTFDRDTVKRWFYRT